MVACLVASVTTVPAAQADGLSLELTRLPNPSGRATAEPGIAAGPDGTVWVASISSPPPTGPFAGVLPGAALWRSTDNGVTFSWVKTPYDLPDGTNQVPIAGSDVDVAVAPEVQSNGHAAVFFAALYASFPTPTQVNLAVSRDSGESWLTVPIVAVPGDAVDRPWVVADGPCTAYVFHLSGVVTPDITTGTGGWWVTKVDVCGAAIAVTEAQPLGTSGGVELVTMGKPTLDASVASPFRHSMYAVMEECATGERLGNRCLAGTRVFAIRSSDGGRSWQRSDIATVANGRKPIWPSAVTTDAAGTVYAVWHDGQHVSMARSGDGGAAWSAPVVLNPTGAGVMPTVSSTGAGSVDVAWYGTDRTGQSDDPQVMGAGGQPGGALWRIEAARSLDGGATFGLRVSGPVVHRGAVCTDGAACDGGTAGAVTLLDDIGMAALPGGRSLVAITNDQPGGTMDDDHIDVAAVAASHTSAAPRVAPFAGAPPAAGSSLPMTGDEAAGRLVIVVLVAFVLLTWRLVSRRPRRDGSVS